MKIEFVSNTGFYLEHRGVVFGMDLWLTQGAFEGSWFHYPPLRKTRWQVSDCKYIYISHLHPDHCDFHALRAARPDACFIVPDYFGKLIERKLRAFGFRNVLSLKANASAQLEPGLKVDLFPQFKNNLFHEAAFGNLIDSALCVQWDGRTILNCNDNYLTPEWAHKLRAAYPRIDLLLAPHSASGPYPANFRNLSREEKEKEARRLQTQYVSYWSEMVQILEPRVAVPCAAEYVVVGNLSEKNPYIGLAEASAAVRDLVGRQGGESPVRPVELDCGTILDLDSGRLEGLPVRREDQAERAAFISSHRDIPFDYHWEDSFGDVDFDALTRSARASLWKKQQRLGWISDYNVYLTIDETPRYGFSLAREGVDLLEGAGFERREPYLECFLPRQLFYQILSRRAHWNNAEGGLHIDFFRRPNTYVPEVFTMLSFLQAEA
jgi:UDP-MurNAc hydroxylase